MTDDNTPPLGPERLVLFHSPDPGELGIQWEHGADGYVRITSIPSDMDEGDAGTKGGEGNSSNTTNNSSNNDNSAYTGSRRSKIGVVEGQIAAGDVLCEAAGVNMRRPISDHMWKLTTGLLRVAPRPIEVRVAAPRTVATEDAESDEDEGDSVCDGSYYQLELGDSADRANAAVHRLPGSPGTVAPAAAAVAASPGDISALSSPPITPRTPQPAMRDPFQDAGRFGPEERRITFHTQSLGVKLHRSPTEGIVHVLHVAPYRPFTRPDDCDPPRVREGPDGGYLEPGDVVLEVGGVDLRGKAIGVAEWADMVHFIRQVGRPLEVVVAKDRLFTRERAGVRAEEAMEEVRTEKEQHEEKQEEGENEGSEIDAAKKEDYSSILEDVRFNVKRDEICNLPSNLLVADDCLLPAMGDICVSPCGSTSVAAVVQPTSPIRNDSTWIKPSRIEPVTVLEGNNYGVSEVANVAESSNSACNAKETLSSCTEQTPSSYTKDDNLCDGDAAAVKDGGAGLEDKALSLFTSAQKDQYLPSKERMDAADVLLPIIEVDSTDAAPNPPALSKHETVDFSPVPLAASRKYYSEERSSPVQKQAGISLVKMPWDKEAHLEEDANNVGNLNREQMECPRHVFPADEPMPSFTATTRNADDARQQKPTIDGADSDKKNETDAGKNSVIELADNNTDELRQEKKKSVTELRAMFSPIKRAAAEAAAEGRVSSISEVEGEANNSAKQNMKSVVIPLATSASCNDVVTRNSSEESWHTATTFEEEKSSDDDSPTKTMETTNKYQSQGLISPPACNGTDETDNNVRSLPVTTPADVPLPLCEAYPPDRSVANPSLSGTNTAAAFRSSSITRSPILEENNLAVARSSEDPDDTNINAKEDPPATVLPTSTCSTETSRALAQETNEGTTVQTTTATEKKTLSPLAAPRPSTPEGNDVGMHVPKLEQIPVKETHKLEATPHRKPATPLNNDSSMISESPFHKIFLQDLKDEFEAIESRDDIAVKQQDEKTTKTNNVTSFPAPPSSQSVVHSDARIISKPEKQRHLISRWASCSSPAGSTVGVGDNNSFSTKKNTLSKRSFCASDAPNSPFVGDIEFGSFANAHQQRAPVSALFSQAFVVQHVPGAGAEEPTNVRWMQTDSPLFVLKKDIKDSIGADSEREMQENQGAVSAGGESSYLQIYSPRIQPHNPKTLVSSMKAFSNSQPPAFDMYPCVEEDPESDTSANLLDGTIVYADSLEDNGPMLDCCGVTAAFCGGESMFEGLVSGSYHQPKEKTKRAFSPRRKTLLSRLRNKKANSKKNKGGDRKNVEYGNLDEDKESCSMKGVRKAHVQLTYQNIRGQTMASANQFSLLLDDEVNL